MTEAVKPVVEANKSAEVVKPPEAAKPEVAKQEAPAEKAPETRLLATVYGDMHDPLTSLDYSVVPREVLKHSLWLDSQIQAGKMVYIDPVKVED